MLRRDHAEPSLIGTADCKRKGIHKAVYCHNMSDLIRTVCDPGT